MRSPLPYIGLLAFTACATPIPQPPPAENLDIGKIGLPDVWPTSTGLPIIGDPGAAPPGAEIRITNLDTTDAPVVTTVATDGSFEATVVAEDGDELRFQLRLEGERLPPVDVLYQSLDFVPGPRIGCFDVALERGFGGVAVGNTSTETLSLDNACSAEASIDAAVFRTGPGPFTFGGVFPSSVPANDSSPFDVDLTPTVAGPAEQIVLITVTIDGEQVRYPVSVFGEGE